MANIHLLARPASDAGTYSGGSWAASLPLANLVTQQPTQVARSTDLAAASTRFVIDLGASRPVQMIALIATNLSFTALARLRVSDAADGTTPGLDVTVTARQPNVPWGSRAWGDFPWGGYEAGIEPGGPITLYRAATPVPGRYVLVDVTDPDNAAGYVQIGRVMAGMPFVPRFNFVTGAALGIIDDTKSSRSLGGQTWIDARPQRRSLKASFDALSEAEAYGALFDVQRRVGLSGNVLAAYNLDDAPGTAARRTLYGTLASLADLVTANCSVDAPYTATLSIEELI